MKHDFNSPEFIKLIQQNFLNIITKQKMTNYYLLTFEEDYTDEHDVPALACFTQEQYDSWLETKQDVYAYLGNSGYGFLEEELQKYDEKMPTGNECKKEGWVSVFKVDESFYNTFHKAHLGSLSLCSIFENYQ